MVMRFFLYIWLFTACQVPVNGPLVHADFQEYVDIFYKQAKKYEFYKPLTTNIQYGEENPEYVATCRRAFLGSFTIQSEVYVNKFWWDRLDWYSRVALIAHELGHCELLQKHREGLVTFMLDEMSPPIFYQRHWGELWRELFKYRGNR